MGSTQLQVVGGQKQVGTYHVDVRQALVTVYVHRNVDE